MDVEARQKQIEEMVVRLKDALIGQPSPVNASDGMTASLLFTYRLAKSLILASPTQEARSMNSKMIVEQLRDIADSLENDEETAPPLILH